MAKEKPRSGRTTPGDLPLQSLTICGFKSIDEARTIHFRPLTILAGANSAGKSTIIQPLLLLKQTLEATYDPGALLLNGPNAKFTSLAQLLPKTRKGGTEGELWFEIRLSSTAGCRIALRRGTATPVELSHILRAVDGVWHRVQPGDIPLTEITTISKDLLHHLHPNPEQVRIRYTPNRCFIDYTITPPDDRGIWSSPHRVTTTFDDYEAAITKILHVPGLRGNPKRNYALTAVGERFPGTFEEYTASVIAAAQRNKDQAFLDQLAADLNELGLAWKVHAGSVDDTQVELKVSRLPKRTEENADDLVSIADVGFGVSQTLPVVVALLTAQPGQLVYIEQPELHLHPRAQHAMAGLLARAAMRGVRVVIETHSSLLLLGIQRLIATGDLDHTKVVLHWFTRNPATGMTDITSADLDSAGRFGDWPEDFDDVTLTAQQAYLDAAEKKLAQ